MLINNPHQDDDKGPGWSGYLKTGAGKKSDDAAADDCAGKSLFRLRADSYCKSDCQRKSDESNQDASRKVIFEIGLEITLDIKIHGKWVYSPKNKRVKEISFL